MDHQSELCPHGELGTCERCELEEIEEVEPWRLLRRDLRKMMSEQDAIWLSAQEEGDTATAGMAASHGLALARAIDRVNHYFEGER